LIETFLEGWPQPPRNANGNTDIHGTQKATTDSPLLELLAVGDTHQEVATHPTSSSSRQHRSRFTTVQMSNESNTCSAKRNSTTSADSSYHTIRKAPELRRIFLEERAEAVEAAAQNRDATKILERIITAEAASKSFNMFSVRPKMAHYHLYWYQGTSQTHGTGSMIRAKSRTPSLNATRNILNSVHRFPSLELGRVSRHLDDAVLRGEIPPEQLAHCTEGAQAILDALQQDIAPPNSIDARITADDMRSGFKAWRETTRTSTSPSGQHLGYYKSIAAFESTPEDDDTPRVSDRIFGVLANNMVDAALQTGFVSERWRKIVNAMIGKIPGRPLLYKL
jgi:hypothetical protein